MTERSSRRLTIVRHADAGPRSAFDGPDRERPITALGHRQANALVEMISDPAVVAIVSSPARRCIETVTPLSKSLGIATDVLEALGEESSGVRALEALIARSPSSGGGIVVGATHGPIFDDLLALIDSRLGTARSSTIVKAGRIELVVDDGEITSAETFPAPVVDGPPVGSGR